ncbi:hypothetical protein HYC85_002468 [Camellia sinensis]|uniref:Uncharacterized protein n=1 Tax=Camellia sinensis TaxID=4442 RepID=A0A7J7I8L2_CAMSI|nr:hypothetical protein HYC85_002468 [Camellia sinensis]
MFFLFQVVEKIKVRDVTAMVEVSGQILQGKRRHSCQTKDNDIWSSKNVSLRQILLEKISWTRLS